MMGGGSPIGAGLIAALTWLGLAGASAQDFPNRPITIVVGVAPGGITDISTRIYAEAVTKRVGQKFIIENRPVGGGTVAAVTVQNAPPDGYTLLTVTGAAHAAIPAMQNVPYDPIKGFQPITLMFRMPALMVAPYESPASSMADLLHIGKTKPGGLSFGSPGVGTPGHLLAAKIGLATNTPIQFIHYRGGAPFMADLIAGRVDFAIASYTSARSNLEGKTIKALAIDADARLRTTPDVPTLTEAGLGRDRVANWFGLAAPAGTPDSVVRKLNEEFVQASRDPEVIRRLTDNGTLIATSTPEQMSALITEEVANMEQLMGVLGLRQK
jgi:tripartite-type tricarboxylate transporter receptor subunit TctC